jgi:hypothetical protein
VKLQIQTRSTSLSELRVPGRYHLILPELIRRSEYRAAQNAQRSARGRALRPVFCTNNP